MLSINNDIEIIGAGYTEATIKLWGYIIFAFVIADFYACMFGFVFVNQQNKILMNVNTEFFSSKTDEKS